jgi:hypothetical protein
MRNALLALLGVGVLALGGYAAASTLDDTVPARTVSLPAATTGDTTTDGTTTGRTTTAETTTAVTTTTATTTTETEDVSGPCDEAEHADDPRCTGIAAGGDDDDRGGDDDHGDDDHQDDDRSGSNSGRG